MCYMACYPEGVNPVDGHREAAAKLNPHGHGWAMLVSDGLSAQGTLYRRRGMYLPEMLHTFDLYRKHFPDAPALWHSRHAGPMTVAHHLAHPLPVGGDQEVLVAHNGYLFPVDEPNRSDSSVFADEILPRYDLNSARERELLSKRMGYNKAVVLSANPTVPPVTILNEHLGTWRNGAWHSNTDFAGAGHVNPGWCAGCGCATGNKDVICLDCEHTASIRRELLLKGIA